MSEQPIRVVVVDANPDEAGAMPGWTSEVPGIEVVGVAHDRSATLTQVEELQPDVLLIDVLLPGLRSIDLIGQVSRSQPGVRILAVTPDDPPHDRIMLATKAGSALAFVVEGNDPGPGVGRGRVGPLVGAVVLVVAAGVRADDPFQAHALAVHGEFIPRDIPVP